MRRDSDFTRTDYRERQSWCAVESAWWSQYTAGDVSGFLGVLRATALIAVLAGASGSLGLMLYSGRHAPWLLIVLFTIWVPFPFVALALANIVSLRWSVLTRATLYSATLVVAVGSLAIYTADAVRPRRAQAAFVYVAVPPASCVLSAVVIAVAGFVSGRRSRPGDGLP